MDPQQQALILQNGYPAPYPAPVYNNTKLFPGWFDCCDRPNDCLVSTCAFSWQIAQMKEGPHGDVCAWGLIGCVIPASQLLWPLWMQNTREALGVEGSLLEDIACCAFCTCCFAVRGLTLRDLIEQGKAIRPFPPAYSGISMIRGPSNDPRQSPQQYSVVGGYSPPHPTMGMYNPSAAAPPPPGAGVSMVYPQPNGGDEKH